MKVLIVYQQLPHYRLAVFQALESTPGIDWTFAAGDSSRDGSIPSIPWADLEKTLRLENRWLGNFLWQRGLLRHLRRERYDAYVFLGDIRYLSTWVASVLLRLMKRRVLFWTIGWHRPEGFVKRSLKLAFYNLADCLLLYGRDGLELGLLAGYSGEKMVVIGNSHDAIRGEIESPPSHLEALLSSVQDRCVGAVARLSTNKRFDLLVKAVHALRLRGFSVTILLVGEGPEREQLAALGKDLSVPIVFTGAIYDAAAIAFLYERIDVTVLPERAGLTVIQSLQHGTPVITVDDPYSQVPEFRAVVPGITGELYQKSNVEDLSEKISIWLEKVSSESATIAVACRSEVANNWSPGGQASKIVEAITWEVETGPSMR